jgi:hypothetical protein
VIRSTILMLVAAALVGCEPPATTTAGFVVAVDSQSVTTVDSFTLRTEDGSLLEFRVGAVELDSGAFPPGHLREHMALGQPVAVAYREEGGERLAFRLVDAPWMAP